MLKPKKNTNQQQKLEIENNEPVIQQEIKKSNRKHQYTCISCEKIWWTSYLTSECRSCHKLYKPLPNEQEFGYCLFKCNCGNSFK